MWTCPSRHVKMDGEDMGQHPAVPVCLWAFCASMSSLAISGSGNLRDSLVTALSPAYICCFQKFRQILRPFGLGSPCKSWARGSM